MLNEVVLTRFGFAELAHPTRKRVGALLLVSDKSKNTLK